LTAIVSAWNQRGPAIRELGELTGESHWAMIKLRLDLLFYSCAAAKDTATAAESLAGTARQEANAIKKDLGSDEEHLARLHGYLTPRGLTQKEMDDLRDAFKPLAVRSVPTRRHDHRAI
jgi:hypothetical protein